MFLERLSGLSIEYLITNFQKMPDQLFNFEGRFITLAQINRIKQERIDAEKEEPKEKVVIKENKRPDVSEEKGEPLTKFDALMEKTAKELKAICIEKKLDCKECKNKTQLSNLILGIIEEPKVEADVNEKVEEKVEAKK